MQKMKMRVTTKKVRMSHNTIQHNQKFPEIPDSKKCVVQHLIRESRMEYDVLLDMASCTKGKRTLYEKITYKD